MLSEIVPVLHSPENFGSGMNAESFHPKVGSLVSVQSRTWAGINKPGGVGRVSKVYYESPDTPTHVDVKYIVNSGGETHVEMIFVQAYYLEDRRRGNDTNTAEATRTNRRSLVPSLEMEESRNDRSSEQHSSTIKKTTLKAAMGDLSGKKRHTDTKFQTRSPKRKTETVQEESSVHNEVHDPPASTLPTDQSLANADNVVMLIPKENPIKKEE